ncbi:cation efflux family protein [Echria macrotheca]|uniref:Cation efflux family protein n=1 Tax=Echria macrotheca TaxID=438768 RepID=A0AAJ0BEX1_9PEZI|nr:cation efflux family protein [Echria macrotheca]
MEQHLLRSITFHPHWFGRHHVLPGFGPSDEKEEMKLQAFRDSHHDNDPFGLLSVYREPTVLTHETLFGRDDNGDWEGAVGASSSKWPTHLLSEISTQWKERRLHNFYRKQNAAIERLLRTVEEHHAQARAEAASEATRVKVAIYSSLAANIVLSGLQLFAAISSGSLSLITTMADAVFDPLSNLMLIIANRATQNVDPNRFPSGRARLETVGNIVFCFLMMAVSFIIIAFSVQDLTERAATGGVNDFHPPALIAAATSFVVKLGLFAYCFTLRNHYSQVRILWQDHRNDLFINGFGILTSVGGSKIAWWIDPTGAIILSIAITVLWLRTAFSEFMLIVGIAASPETQQLVTYVSLTHNPTSISGIDTVRVYYSGPRLIVEVDVVMDDATQLSVAHDVAEGLQYKLESLPNIERAYVHVDYETKHKPEHAYVKHL